MEKKLKVTAQVDSGKITINTKTWEKEKAKVKKLAGQLGAELRTRKELETALDDAREVIDWYEAERAGNEHEEQKKVQEMSITDGYTLHNVRIFSKDGDSPMDDIVVHGIIDAAGRITVRDDGTKTSKNKDFRFIESNPEIVRGIGRALVALADKAQPTFDSQW